MLEKLCKQTCKIKDYRHTHTRFNMDTNMCECFGVDDDSVPADVVLIDNRRHACTSSGPGSIGSPVQVDGEFRATDCRALDVSSFNALKADLESRAGYTLVNPDKYKCGDTGDPGACRLKGSEATPSSQMQQMAQKVGISIDPFEMMEAAGSGNGRESMKSVVSQALAKGSENNILNVLNETVTQNAPSIEKATIATMKARREESRCLTALPTSYAVASGRFKPTPYTSGNSTNALTSI